MGASDAIDLAAMLAVKAQATREELLGAFEYALKVADADPAPGVSADEPVA